MLAKLHACAEGMEKICRRWKIESKKRRRGGKTLIYPARSLYQKLICFN
jgi:hypothetical protein